MLTCSSRRLALTIATTVLLINSGSVFASHRRFAAGGAHRHCQLPAPQFAQPLPTYAAAPQAAPIPPALVPLVMTVGQDVAGLAAQRLIELINSRLKLDQQPTLPINPINPELSTKSDLQSVNSRLDTLEKKLGISAPPPSAPQDIKKGSIPLPSGKPSQFPRFLTPQ